MKTGGERIGVGSSVRIPCRDATLSGELIIPREAQGLVLFAHGSGSSRFSPRNQFVAQILRESGMGTLLFDLLTGYEEAEDAYTAQFRFNIELLAERLLEATHWVFGQSEAQNLGIGYFGSSTGGAAALMAAANDEVSIDAVVSRGGRPDLAGEALQRVRSPTLLIVGELDRVVWQLNQAAFSRLSCEKDLKIVPGATHLFEEKGSLEEVAHLASDWFIRHLHPRHSIKAGHG